MSPRFLRALLPRFGSTQRRSSSMASVFSSSPQKPLTPIHIVQESDAISKWIKKPLTTPSFEVINPGTSGSILQVKLPAKSSIFTYPTAAMAMHTTISTHYETRTGIVNALSNKLVGGFLFVSHFSTKHESGEVLLAPRLPGDIFVLNLDGTTEYYLSRGAFLAATNQVLLGASMTMENFSIRLSGVGTIAFAAFGGLNRIILGPGDAVIANPDHLIAWSGSSRVDQSILRTYYQSARRFFGMADPQKDYITISGPADVFLSSRISGGRVRKEFEVGKVPPSEPTKPAPSSDSYGNSTGGTSAESTSTPAQIVSSSGTTPSSLSKVPTPSSSSTNTSASPITPASVSPNTNDLTLKP
ncbi:hypothetical protein SeLEV6574_g07229 [Synchytrium endobioticum]|uniref:Altered inheritance of mitochondria protein 24, mitochondrial n=1 Tax=Synchytrium endobioticum TaxID=286115 RepID=A0A507CLE2_9FUNG|nr:hypothetical protein SeLEV6574_g07229 [Synchytrium endobioticum]